MLDRYFAGQEMTDAGDVWLNDLTAIEAVTQSRLDFIQGLGYADGDYTDDPAKGELWITRRKQEDGQFALVSILGVPVLQDRFHLIVHAENVDLDADPPFTGNCFVPWRSFNGPTATGTYTGELHFTKTDGVDDVIFRWTEVWL